MSLLLASLSLLRCVAASAGVTVVFFFFGIHYCAPRGTEPHVALPCTSMYP